MLLASHRAQMRSRYGKTPLSLLLIRFFCSAVRDGFGRRHVEDLHVLRLVQNARRLVLLRLLTRFVRDVVIGCPIDAYKGACTAAGCSATECSGSGGNPSGCNAAGVTKCTDAYTVRQNAALSLFLFF